MGEYRYGFGVQLHTVHACANANAVDPGYRHLQQRLALQAFYKVLLQPPKTQLKKTSRPLLPPPRITPPHKAALTSSQRYNPSLAAPQSGAHPPVQ
jgi:hypothetical protein